MDCGSSVLPFLHIIYLLIHLKEFQIIYPISTDVGIFPWDVG